MERDLSVTPLRILVVEDHKAFLNCVLSALRKHSDVEIVGEAQNGLEAVERAATLQPDLILLDIGLPGLNGIEAARRIRTIAANTKIVFLSQESSPEIVQEAFRLGARGYILKTFFARDLATALRVVMDGEKFLSEELDGRPTAPLTISGLPR
jgi:DNA-binding NarL/FixJ family response regulator